MTEQEPLVGTVKLYTRHLLVCTGRSDWICGRIDEEQGLLGRMAADVLERKETFASPVKLTACDEPSQSGAHDRFDLLVFPDMLAYLNVGATDWERILLEHLEGDQPVKDLPTRPLTGQWVFVCAHASRDSRCGSCGPLIAERFQQELTDRGISERVHVRRTSHIGGHRFAGVMVIYPEGDWYGRLEPDDIPALIDQHIQKGTPLLDHWRGRMGE